MCKRVNSLNHLLSGLPLFLLFLLSLSEKALVPSHGQRRRDLCLWHYLKVLIRSLHNFLKNKKRLYEEEITNLEFLLRILSTAI